MTEGFPRRDHSVSSLRTHPSGNITLAKDRSAQAVGEDSPCQRRLEGTPVQKGPSLSRAFCGLKVWVRVLKPQPALECFIEKQRPPSRCISGPSRKLAPCQHLPHHPWPGPRATAEQCSAEQAISKMSDQLIPQLYAPLSPDDVCLDTTIRSKSVL